MGEVYRARDARLARDVAIKVLPTEFALHADRLARFEREAKAAAGLNHPNIVAVFDVGIESQLPFVVSELLEGTTLRDELLDGALPQKTAIDLTIQIASGLAAAHQKGIVHRDLTPANVFLTVDGRAKILDFGLARLTETADARTSVPLDLTTRPATALGMVLGTVGYMSPEQVRGEAADHRSDIFALGAVFYEMLSGRRAFARDTAPETMTAILKEDPPAHASGARVVAPAVDRIVRRCLEKNPLQRFQSVSDIAFALEAISGSTMSPVAAADTPGSSWWRRIALGAIVAGAITIGFMAARQLTGRRSDAVMFQPMTFDRRSITNARFMPDGQTIVYSAASRGYSPDLFLINPSAEAPQALGVSGAQLLSVSSKGELAIILGARFLAQRVYGGTLARMTLGSSPRPMLEQVREADWSPDGASLAIVHDLGAGRDRLEYPVGTALHEVSGYLSDPRVSPDGDRVAFFEHQWRFDDRGWVKVVNRAGHVTTLAGEFWGLEGLAWTPDGSTVVFSGNTAGGNVMQPMSVPVSGHPPAQTVFGVPGRFIVYDVARDGRWLAVREDLSFGIRARVPSQSTERDLSWLGSSGAKGMSADGEWLLLVDVGPRGGRNYGVVLRKTDASQALRLGEGNAQTFSPDGNGHRRFSRRRHNSSCTRPVRARRFASTPVPIDRYETASWFPDGKRLLICGSGATRAPRCYEQDLAGSPPHPLAPEGVLATLAPDGRTLLLSMPDGAFHLSSVDGGAHQIVVGMTAEDRQIAWSRDSRSLFVQPRSHIPATVERVDLRTGTRTVVRQLMPEGVGDVASIVVTDWIDDGRWYAYNYTSLPSTLFVVSGAMTPR